MDNLINFPIKEVREKISFEKTVRVHLSQYNITSPDIDLLMIRLLPLWDKYQHKFSISFSLPETLQKIDSERIHASFRESLERFQRDLHEFNSTLLLDRVNAEIKLFLLERGI